MRFLKVPAIRVDFGICILAALALLILPLRWLLAALLAASVHELGHTLALYIFGIPIRGIRIGGSGAVICTGQISPGREAICALAGPSAGLLLILFARWLPHTAICAAVHSAFNLLPIYPLDGGRAMQSGLTMWFGRQTSDSICGVIEKSLLIVLFLLGICGTLWFRLGILPLILTSVLCLRVLFRKIPCKSDTLAVQ